jgi:hypothetical protein
VALTAWAAQRGRDELLARALAAVLSPRWVPVARALIEGLWAQRLDAIVINAALAIALFLISTLLLPLRERISVAFEQEARLVDEPGHPTQLVHVALDVLISVLILFSAQVCIFAIGYTRDPGRRALATVLSYAFLFASCAMDLVPPLLLRHGLRTSAALAALGRAPLASAGFGLVFAAPALLGAWLAAGATPERRLVVMVAATVLGVLWGTLGGTALAARLYTAMRGLPPPSARTRALAWIALLALSSACGWVTVLTARALEHKVQLFACRFHVDRSSLAVEAPRLGALLHGRVATTVRATIEIENPTPRDVVFEPTRFEITREGTLVARAELGAGRIAAGQTSRYPIEAPIELAARELQHATNARQWEITAYVLVAPGMEVPIFLR